MADENVQGAETGGVQSELVQQAPTNTAGAEQNPAPENPANPLDTAANPEDKGPSNPLEGANPETPPVEQAPEQYQPFKLGDYGELSPEQTKAFGDVARELNLTQEKAQKVVESMVPAMTDHMKQQVHGYATNWLKQSEIDPEIGGEKFKANLAVAKLAYDKFATPELKKILTSSGLSCNAEVLRMFYRMGKQMQADRGVQGSREGTAEFVKYPNSPDMR